MTIAVSSLETHYALAAHEATGLPIRAIVGQWVRELGAGRGIARFPGPRRNPGNVTIAYVGQVVGHLQGGDAHEQHRFPVFASAGQGVLEYSFWMTHLDHYKHIAPDSHGSWTAACDLIGRSPWSSDHYGHDLAATARICTIALVSVHRAGVVVDRPDGTRVVAHVSPGQLLASAGRFGSWFRVRVGSGDGAVGYISSGVASPTTA